MRKTKRTGKISALVSLLLSLALVLSLAAPALAAESGQTGRAVGVMLNGKQLDFGETTAILTSGRTMVPAKAMMEALGGTFQQEEGTLRCTLGDTEITFTTAGDTRKLWVKDAAGERTVDLDVENYYSADADDYFVPVRFLTEALGCDVYWDGDIQSAVLVDGAATAAEMDRNFTALNQTLEKLETDPSKNYKTRMTYDIGISLEDEDAGEPVEATLHLTLDMISSASKIEMSGTLDASELREALDLESDADADVNLLTDLLSECTFQLRMDLETMVLYVQFPQIVRLMTALGVLEDAEDTADIWYKLDILELIGTENLSDVAGFDVDRLAETDSSIGSLVYAVYNALTEAGEIRPAALYDTAISAGGVLATLLGDSSAEQSEEIYSWTIDLDTIAALIQDEEIEADLQAALESCTITLKADPAAGKMDVDFDIQTKEDGEGETPAMSLTGSMTLTLEKETLNMKLDMGALGSVVYDLLATIAETEEVPETLPPEGAQTGDLAEILSTALAGILEDAVADLELEPDSEPGDASVGIIGGADGPTAVLTTETEAA